MPRPSHESRFRAKLEQLKKVVRTFTCKPRPESGLDCLMCARFQTLTVLYLPGSKPNPETGTWSSGWWRGADKPSIHPRVCTRQAVYSPTSFLFTHKPSIHWNSKHETRSPDAGTWSSGARRGGRSTKSSASEQRGNKFERLKGFYLKAKAGIWP